MCSLRTRTSLAQLGTTSRFKRSLTVGNGNGRELIIRVDPLNLFVYIASSETDGWMFEIFIDAQPKKGM